MYSWFLWYPVAVSSGLPPVTQEGTLSRAVLHGICSPLDLELAAYPAAATSECSTDGGVVQLVCHAELYSGTQAAVVCLYA